MERMMPRERLTPLLPDDIMVDILSRLPVRSLARSRCVSKCWNSLLRSRRFIELHMHRGYDTEDGLRLLFSPYPPALSIKCADISMSSKHMSDENAVWLAPSSSPDWSSFLGALYKMESVGCCNGLLFFQYMGQKMIQGYIWNPATGAIRCVSEDDVAARDICDETLPGFEERPLGSNFGLGFGYDSAAVDYKIVRHWTFEDEVDGFAHVDVFSIGSHTLRRFQERIRGELESVYGVFLHGSLHWLLRKDIRPSKAEAEYCILRFNLETEKLDEIALQIPDKTKADGEVLISRDWDLGVLDEQLHVLVGYELGPLRGDSDMWVMQEYGVESSWNKRVSIPYDLDELDFAVDQCLPLYISRDGGVVVERGCFGSSKIVMCDPQQRTFEEMVFPDSWGECCFWSIVVYVESLVSPFHISNPNWRFEE